MAEIIFEHITKCFKKVTALNNVSLNIKNNEFFVIFGPAGAGKTTLLNVVAGITFPEKGKIYFDGVIANHLEPQERNVSMVFENYALYPHMTAYDNIASPMRSKANKKSEEEIKPIVEGVAKTLNISELLDRLPSRVSNGQKQRIALGRALVRKPKAFLLDEPLAHLDAKLRHAMRKELKYLQRSLDTTTIYVTHDYTEAMSLGDRIGVINEGVIQQIGTPDEVYYTPVNKFVARLFGEPEINIFTCKFDGKRILLPWQGKTYQPDANIAEKLHSCGYTSVDVGVRATKMRHTTQRVDENQIECRVYSLEPLGNRTEIIVKVEEQLLRMIAHVNTDLVLDQPVYISIDLLHAIFFDCETGNYITRFGEDQLRRGENIG